VSLTVSETIPEQNKDGRAQLNN